VKIAAITLRSRTKFRAAENNAPLDRFNSISRRFSVLPLGHPDAAFVLSPFARRGKEARESFVVIRSSLMRSMPPRLDKSPSMIRPARIYRNIYRAKRDRKTPRNHFPRDSRDNDRAFLPISSSRKSEQRQCEKTGPCLLSAARSNQPIIRLYSTTCSVSPPFSSLSLSLSLSGGVGPRETGSRGLGQECYLSYLFP